MPNRDPGIVAAVVQALDEVNDGFSADRVIADPELNERFVAACRRLGLADSVFDLNRRLLNLRKSSQLSGRRRSRRTHFADSEYRFASEVAARVLEHQLQSSLDLILCDPEQASQFDKIAAELAPGYDPLRYRWAALSLRKKRLLKPEHIGHALGHETLMFGRVDQVDIASIPAEQGIYIFYSASEALYVGEAENLRLRIRKHLDHSDRKALAYWFWEHGVQDVRLEIRQLANDTTTRQRRALEAELIASRRPKFNIHRP